MKKLQIAVGIIRNENNEIFITRRAADAHMANKLEFPGGKIEMARPANASVSYTHVKSTFTIGEAGSTKKAYVNFLSDS